MYAVWTPKTMTATCHDDFVKFVQNGFYKFAGELTFQTRLLRGFSPECNVCSKKSHDCSSGTVHPYKLQCMWDCVFAIIIALHNSREKRP